MMVAVGILALLVFALFGVVVELYRDVRQLREVAGILDRPLNVAIGTVAGSSPSSYGLPETLDSAGTALVLFLSDRCATCRSLAAGLGGGLPPGLWLVLESITPVSARSFIDSFNLASMIEDGRLTVDAGGEIAQRIGLDTTPVGFRIEQGQLTSATTVPSRRYLFSILPNPISLKPTENFSKQRRAG